MTSPTTNRPFFVPIVYNRVARAAMGPWTVNSNSDGRLPAVVQYYCTVDSSLYLTPVPPGRFLEID